jgi:hypothetical protein
MIHHIDLYYENPNQPISPIIFKIGKLLNGHINVGVFQTTETGTLFGKSTPYKSNWIDYACLTVKLYEYHREVIKCFSISMIRNGIPRDIYRIINKMIIKGIVYFPTPAKNEYCLLF